MYMTYAEVVLSKLSGKAQHPQQEILRKVHYTESSMGSLKIGIIAESEYSESAKLNIS